MGFEGRTALITGGASGIGEAVVRAFVREGVRSTILDVDAGRGSALAEELAADGACSFIRTDVSDEASCAAAVEETERRYGAISYLVNDAAVFLYRSVDATPAEWRRVLDTNVVGASLMARHAAASMRRAGGGAIVNVSSISAFIAQPGTMTYNVTKAALVEMTRCMALDLGPFGIRVNAVCPGYTLTRSFREYAESAGRQPDEFEREIAQQTILKRLGRPEEVAKCVLFLCSDDALYITATSVVVDGGLMAL